MPPSADNKPLLVILGPTASGKSLLGLALAKKLDGEIISCDSVQLYRGFDVGSAKTPESERRDIPHHLIDVLDPTEIATAADYARMARGAMADITSRGRVPIIVGGTGLYLRATLHGLFQGPGRDEDLRGRLERISSEKGPEQLHRIFTRLDPDSAARIHHNDRPKVIRAIEVCLLTRQSLSAAFEQGSEEALSGYRILQIGLAPPRKELYERINQRTHEMFSGGLLEEVKTLLDAGIPADAWSFGAVGYKQALEVIRGGVDRDEAVAAAAQATRRYSKRQMTWFRRQEPTTVWLEGFGDDAQIQQEAHHLASN
jgi:tRNA dimethylallyltransferase